MSHEHNSTSVWCRLASSGATLPTDRLYTGICRTLAEGIGLLTLCGLLQDLESCLFCSSGPPRVYTEGQCGRSQLARSHPGDHSTGAVPGHGILCPVFGKNIQTGSAVSTAPGPTGDLGLDTPSLCPSYTRLRVQGHFPWSIPMNRASSSQSSKFHA